MSKAHLHKPREAPGHNGRQGTQIEDLEKGTPHQVCNLTRAAVLGKPSAPLSRHDIHDHDTMPECLLDSGLEVLLPGVWDVWGAGEEHFGIAKDLWDVSWRSKRQGKRGI